MSWVRVAAVFGTWAVLGCSGKVVAADGSSPLNRDGSVAEQASDGSVSRAAGGAASRGPVLDAAPQPGCLDLSAVGGTPVISFKDDLMPIFGLSCVASSCHDMAARKADLVLGDPSACGPSVSCYDPTAKWLYRFPGPIPDALLSTVYKNLVDVPSTVVASVRRVAPGDPNHSFLVDTLVGTENSSPYSSQCKNPNPEIVQSPCGGDMPLNTANLCEDDPAKVQAIVQWIAQGAQMN